MSAIAEKPRKKRVSAFSHRKVDPAYYWMTVPAMILFIPVILPVAVKLGISPIHLGIIVVMTLAIGLVTPPYGLCLLIASSIADLSIEKSLRGVLPYISADMLVVIIITLIPAVALFFPKLLGLM